MVPNNHPLEIIVFIFSLIPLKMGVPRTLPHIVGVKIKNVKAFYKP